MKPPYWERATPSEKLMSHLLSCKSSYIQRKSLKSLVESREEKERNAWTQALYRLKKDKLLTINGDNFYFNKSKFIEKNLYGPIREKPVGSGYVIILFDIPEKQRKIRNWLRKQLKLWDFTMMQQSVWLGKGDLPKKFKDHINLLGIKKCIKIFKAEKIKM